MHLKVPNDVGNGYDLERNNLKHNNLRKFKKLRTTAPAKKRHFKIELHIRLSVSRLFHVHHVVQIKIGEVHFRLLGTNGFHEMKDLLTAAGSPCRDNFKYVNFITSFGGLSRQTASKRVLQVQHDYYSYSTNLLNPCGVVVAVAAVVS